MLYIENPAGVGYSWAPPSQRYLLVKDDFNALKEFFKIFPAYLKNDLWVTGLSYRGVYAPYLSWQIHEWNLAADIRGDF
jgi:carboxypeptidase C (cathepsin A)